jgi:mannonate dehydratase
MNRRNFLQGGAAAAAGSFLGPAQFRAQSASPKRVLTKVGTQLGEAHPSDQTLGTLAALGVNHICCAAPSPRLDENWSVEGLTRLKARIESFGLKLEMVALPMSSVPLDRAENPNILLGKSPERDHEIADICEMLRNLSRAGIPAAKYNFTLLGVIRSKPARGPGGVVYSTFDYAEVMRESPPLTKAGRVSADEMWDRITYFLKRVVPVAEECKVKIACHPQDPGLPKTGFRGVQAVLSNVDGLKRFVDITPSPYHGLNFCQGTVSEMLEDPGEQIYDVIRYFGVQRKIFNVHFRNIHGRFLNFHEAFPPNGSVDMVRAMRVYKEVGYDGMMMPDHAPQVAGDEGNKQAFAYEFGYIEALLQAVAAEP